ncbi:MAG: leucine-rich repeat domain-containing protein [Clostridia bacterium]|nr:leucine-rich repeat domain-containing protein [Clostridia bacterium]
MKKILIVLLAVAMVSSVVMTGCSNTTGGESSSSNSNSVSQVTSSVESSSSSSDSTLSGTESSANGETTDGDFVWQDGKYITNLSDEGATKKEIVIPENCQMIMINDLSIDSKFHNNENLESIEFESENIKSLPQGFFNGDINLKKVELPKNLKKIPELLFANCNALESVEIPSSVTEIESSAFESTAIKEMKIPESVTTVGETVFRFTTIEKLYLPESLTSIDNAFLSDLDNDNPDYKLTVYVKKGSYADTHFDDYKKSITVKEYY